MQKTFQVLPTDERFLTLTAEQIELLYEHHLVDNPETEQVEHYQDPEYEKNEKTLAVAGKPYDPSAEIEAERIDGD